MVCEPPVIVGTSLMAPSSNWSRKSPSQGENVSSILAGVT